MVDKKLRMVVKDCRVLQNAALHIWKYSGHGVRIKTKIPNVGMIAVVRQTNPQNCWDMFVSRGALEVKLQVSAIRGKAATSIGSVVTVICPCLCLQCLLLLVATIAIAVVIIIIIIIIKKKNSIVLVIVVIIRIVASSVIAVVDVIVLTVIIIIRRTIGGSCRCYHLVLLVLCLYLL